MNAIDSINRGRLPLERGAILRMDDVQGSLVHVWQGAVWITQNDDRRDYYVRAGEYFRIGRDGVTVISAITDGVLVSLSGRPAARPGLLVRVLAALGLAHAGASA
jgi:hypothetical protein